MPTTSSSSVDPFHPDDSTMPSEDFFDQNAPAFSESAVQETFGLVARLQLALLKPWGDGDVVVGDLRATILVTKLSITQANARSPT